MSDDLKNLDSGRGEGEGTPMSNSDGISDFPGETPRPKRSVGFQLRLGHLLAAVGIIALLIALLLPATRSAREPARRIQCVNNLKQIALALRAYESTYEVLPPAHTVDAAGRPLHSWRTLILPYLDQQPLYDSIDLSKPWNDPANAKAYGTVVSTYCCPSQTGPVEKTAYLAVVGTDGCFLPDSPRPLSQITDDSQSTLMVIEASLQQAVHWMSPMDADEPLILEINPQSKLNHPGGFNAAFADGSVKFIKAGLRPERRRAIISISGNDNEIDFDAD
jgi:prepilin-type processing-associated H-X9-DG protein